MPHDFSRRVTVLVVLAACGSGGGNGDDDPNAPATCKPSTGFGAARIFSMPTSEPAVSLRPMPIDIDGDDDVDVAYANGNNAVEILINDGAGNLAQRRSLSGVFGYGFKDVDNDGIADWVQGTGIRFGTGGGDFASITAWPAVGVVGGEPRAQGDRSADLDGDGDVDFFAGVTHNVDGRRQR